eukprot:TRINITY_DN713_c0_g1_i1.p1 TRINITY_DN713_c0_g1~~TRINITY_DN713_c0_g1_i1.p1  ORF type:complete len:717 (+),score=266.06 TRINITY_DN713_c0_g1_i1:66-2153(+)
MGDKAPQINNLYTDLQNGVVLMHLFTCLFGSKVRIPKFNTNPTMKVHFLDNVTQALNILDQVGIVSPFLKPANIVDGDQNMISGLIWMMILRTQISVLNKNATTDENGKKALLEWCQKRLSKYGNVKVNDFTHSWKDGLAFCALMHSQNPNVVNYNALDPNRPDANLQLAFKIGEDRYHIPKLLEVSDLLQNPIPDEKSIMTYVAEIAYHFNALGEPEIDLQRRKDELEEEYKRRMEEHQKKLLEEQRKQNEENQRRQQETERLQKEALQRQQEAQRLTQETGLQKEELLRRQEQARIAQEEYERMQRLAEEERLRVQEQQEELQRQMKEMEEGMIRQKQEFEKEKQHFMQQKQLHEQQMNQQQNQLNQQQNQLQQQHSQLSQQQNHLSQQQNQLLSEKEQLEKQRLLHEQQQQQNQLQQQQQMELMRRQMEEEKQKLENERLRMLKELEQQKQNLNQQEMLQRREFVEKEFAEKAKAFDLWLEQHFHALGNLRSKSPQEQLNGIQLIETQFSVGDQHSQTMDQISQQAAQVGLTTNRFTQLNLNLLKEKFGKLKHDCLQLKEQANNALQQQRSVPNYGLGMPPPQQPPMPNYGLGMPMNQQPPMPNYGLGMPQNQMNNPYGPHTTVTIDYNPYGLGIPQNQYPPIQNQYPPIQNQYPPVNSPYGLGIPQNQYPPIQNQYPPNQYPQYPPNNSPY